MEPLTDVRGEARLPDDVGVLLRPMVPKADDEPPGADQP